MISNRIYFTDFFGVDGETMEEYGAFNISLLNDLPLFIDPFLIFCSAVAEYRKLHDDIINYMIYLRDRAQECQTPDEGMLRSRYCFPEVKQTYLGFCEDGNCGRGLGMDFANSLHTGLKDIFKDFGDEQITDSPHLEKLCLFKEHVGRDNISDFVTNIIKQFLLIYTENFAKKYIDPSLCQSFRNIPKVKFNYELGIWQSGSYYLPYYKNDYVLLTPVDMLVGDETWINKKDMYNSFEYIAESISDVSLRFEINQYFYSFLTKEPKKPEKISAAQKTIEKYPQFIDYYIRRREDSVDLAIANSVSEVGGVKQLFVDQLQELVEQLKRETDFYKIKPNSFAEAMERIIHLKHVIEDCDGHRWFYDGDKPIRREADLHILYKLACFDTFSDVNSEVNNGHGPVDFKFSNSRKDSTLVEFKLTRTLKKNLEKQVDVYKNANNTDKAIKVILYFTEEEQSKTEAILKELGLTGKPGIVLIDARKDNKPSASKAS